MTASLRLLGPGLLGLLLSGCLSARERATLDRYMECTDCVVSGRDSVAAIGWRVVPTLGTYVVDGPSAPRRAAGHLAEDSAVHRLARWQALHPGPRPAVTSYGDTYELALAASYRARSARALMLVGGRFAHWLARRYLARALTLALAPDVHAIVQSAYDSF